MKDIMYLLFYSRILLENSIMQKKIKAKQKCSYAQRILIHFYVKTFFSGGVLTNQAKID